MQRFAVVKCLRVCRINFIHAKSIGTHADVSGCNYGTMMEHPYCLSSHHVSNAESIQSNLLKWIALGLISIIRVSTYPDHV